MREYKPLPIARWAAEDIPSEKARNNGIKALTNAELLSIIIGSGSVTENAVDLSRRLLADCDNSLKRLYKMRIDEIKSFNGIGEQKASKIHAALELAHRMNMELAEKAPDLSTATYIYNYMHPRIGMLDVEEFWVIYLNQHYRLIQAKRISYGGLSEVLVDVRIIIREAVLCNATIVVVCHNHPSGSLSPSKIDCDLTNSIKRACELMRLLFLDHVIVTDGAYYSFHEQGRI